MWSVLFGEFLSTPLHTWYEKDSFEPALRASSLNNEKEVQDIRASQLIASLDLFGAYLTADSLTLPQELFEALHRGRKKEQLLLFAVVHSDRANIIDFANVRINNYLSGIDLLSFTEIHENASFLIFTDQLAAGLDRDEYSFFIYPRGLLHYGKLVYTRPISDFGIFVSS